MAADAPARDTSEHSVEAVFSAGSGYAPAEAPALARPAVKRPMVFVALAFMGGAGVGRWILVPAPVLGAVAVFVLFFYSLLLYRGRRQPVPLASGYLLLLAIGLIGWIASNQVIRIDRRAETIAEQFTGFALTRAEGRVAEPPQPMGRVTNVVLEDVRLASAPAGPEIRTLPLKLNVVVRGEEPLEALLTGSRVEAWGRVALPEGRSHPADFDRAAWLNSRAIAAELIVASANDVEVLVPPTDPFAPLRRAFHHLRDFARSNLKERLSPGGYGLAAGLLLGDKQALDPLEREAFRQVGLSHLLSVSGLHTGFALVIALGLVRLFFLPVRAWWIFALGALWFYAALVGFRPPVVRAALMGSFLLFGWHLGRTTSLLSALAVSAFVTLAMDPRNLIRSDWQLSYLSVLSILVFVPMLYDLIVRPEPEPLRVDRPLIGWRPQLNQYALRYLLAPFIVALAVQMGMMPLQLALFGETSPAAFAANIVGVPLAFVIVLLSGMLAALGWMPLVGDVLGITLDGAGSLLLWWTHLLGRTPLSLLLLPALPPLVALVYYTFLFVGPHLRIDSRAAPDEIRRRRLHALMRVGVFALVLVWLPLIARPPRGLLELYVLDVGQGDSLVVRLPDSRIMVIDAGGGFGPGQGRSTVDPFLRWLGARRIDVLVASHADADHIGGLDYLVEAYDVGLFLHGGDEAETDAWRELQDALEGRDVPVREVRAGERLAGLGPVEATILNPLPGQGDNDASVVMLIDYHDVEMLLTGDIEAPAERRILESGLARDVEILKVAHHGSRSSTLPEFLEATRPEVAVISAGRGNRFGHPAPSVVERLEERGVAVARTDLSGTIRIRTDGRRFQVHHFGDFDPAAN